ncbi:MAG: biotin--[acetyl-CoA-carboxylase] ligase [Pirellulales bacterium]
MSDPLGTLKLRQNGWLQHTVYASSMPSTNDLALGLAADRSLATPALVVTTEQTAGRGRGANRWWSAPGSLTFSLVLDLPESLDIARRSQLALVAGLGIRDAVARWSTGLAQVKWPNDVYVDRRKISGILIEASAARPLRAVVGVGVNVNNSLAEAPEEVRQRATSFCDLLGHTVDMAAVLSSTLDLFRARLDRWFAAPGSLAEDWSPHCLLTGRAVAIESGGRRIEGRCQGIGPSGELRVQTLAGLTTCMSGVVVTFD